MPASAATSDCRNLFDEWIRFHNQHLSFQTYDELTEEFRFTRSTLLGARLSAQMNERQIQNLESFIPKSRSSDKEFGLSLKEVDEILHSVMTHQVASRFQLERYDPKHCGIGFCFGRAMTVHLEAIFNYGLTNQQVRKLWAVGNLGNYRYHVTSLVYSEAGWMAIDPNLGKAVSLRDWYKNEKAKDETGDLLVFATSPKRFGPSIPKYNPNALSDPYYNNYFRDLLNYYRQTVTFIANAPFTPPNYHPSN